MNIITGKVRRYGCVLLVGFAMIFAGFTVSGKNTHVDTYYTANGLEPDKWASVWLISKYAEPTSNIEVRPRWSLDGEGIPFDILGSELYRKDGLGSVQVIANHFDIEDPAVIQIGRIISDIELNTWRKNAFPETAVIEAHFRSLQEKFSRIDIPVECYRQFFDAVESWLRLNSNDLEQLNHQLDIVSKECALQSQGVIVDLRQNYVPTVEIDSILEVYASGASVVFVDTREPEEFKEAHIPGAINLPLRELDQIPESLKSADMVVSYCVKDFRGYEVARTLLQTGVKNSVIMKPYGIKGWVSEGLPVTNSEISPEESIKRLRACAGDRGSCENVLISQSTNQKVSG